MSLCSGNDYFLKHYPSIALNRVRAWLNACVRAFGLPCARQKKSMNVMVRYGPYTLPLRHIDGERKHEATCRCQVSILGP